MNPKPLHVAMAGAGTISNRNNTVTAAAASNVKISMTKRNGEQQPRSSLSPDILRSLAKNSAVGDFRSWRALEELPPCESTAAGTMD